MYTMEDSQHCGKEKQSSPEKVSKKAAVESDKQSCSEKGKKSAKVSKEATAATSETPQRHKQQISCPPKSEKKRLCHIPKNFPINTM